MKRILLLLLIFSPLSLFATTYISEFPIYLHGDVRPIAAVFNSIAMVTGHDIYKTMVWLGVFSAAVVTTFALLFRADFGSATKTGVFTVGAVSILLVPVDVHIIDKRLDYGMLSPQYTEVTLGYEKVSNVPFLTALAPSIATTVSSDVIDVIEAAFQGNTINYSGMEDIGKVGFASLGFGSIFEMSNKLLKQFSIENVGDDDASKEAAMLFSKYFKDYITQCIIPASAISPLVKKAMVSPDGDIFDALSPSNLSLPASLSVSTTDKDGVPFSQSCSAFYTSSVTPNLLAIQPAVKNRIQEITKVANLSDLDASSRILLADMTSNVIGGSVEQLSIFMQNYAVTPLVEASVSNSYRNSGMSGIEIANNITGKASTAQLQGEGLGRFKWTVEILPYAMHFLFSAIVAASILSLIFLVARGFGGGFAIAKNYFVGFIQFESIRISMALVNNLVLFYAAIGAVDKMAEFGDNAVSITKIPAYLDYIATMEGIMGMLGLSAIFLIPAIVFKGDLTMAVSSIQGLSNRYIGNDVATAREKAANSAARQKTVAGIQNDEEAMAKLSKMGIDNIPKGRMPLEYYQSVMNGMKGLGQAAGAMASYDKAEAYASGNMKQSANMINQTAGYGATASFNSAANVGYQDGQVQGHMTNNTSSLRNSTNWNASDVGRGRALEGLGKDLSSMGVSRGVSNSEVDQFAKGSENMGRIGANKTLGAGRLNLTRDDMSAIQRVSSAGIESEIGKGHAIKRNREEFGSDVYRDASKYGEMSNIHKTMAKIKEQGTIENAVKADYADSAIKAQSQLQTVDAHKRHGIIGEDGHTTATGREAMAIAPGEQAKALVAKAEIGKQIDEAFKKLQKGLSQEEIDKKFAPFSNGKDANGNHIWKTGQEFWETVAAQKQGVFKGHNAIMMGDGTIANVGFGLDGGVTAKLEEGISRMQDNSNTSTSLKSKITGSKTEHYNEQVMLHNTAPLVTLAMQRHGGDMKKAANWARSAEGAKWMMDPRNELAVLAAEAGFQIHDKTGADEEGSTLTTMGLVGGAVGGTLLNRVTQKPVMADLEGANKIYNKEGKLTGYEDADGNRIANANGEMLDKNGKVVKRGAVSRGAHGVWSGLTNGFSSVSESLSDRFSFSNTFSNPSDSSVDRTTNSGPDKDNSDPKKSTSNHNPPPTNDMPNDNIENPKKPNPQPKINNFSTETELKAAGAMPDNPNVRTNGFYNQLANRFNNAVNMATTKGSGFISKGLIFGGAMLMGSASDAFANTMNVLDPSQLIVGQELGAGSDIPRVHPEGRARLMQMQANAMNTLNGDNPYVSTAASSALMQQSVSSPTVSMGGGDVGAQAQNLAMVLRDTNVQQEIGNAMVQSKFSTSLANDNSQQMMMETKINDVSNIVRRNLPNMDFSVNENMQEEIRKELARVRRIAKRG